jgi:hypothetical protein
MKAIVKVLFVLLAVGALAMPQPAQACGGYRCKLAPTTTNPFCLRCLPDEAATNSTCVNQGSCSCAFVACFQAAEAERQKEALEEIGIATEPEPQSCAAPTAELQEVAWAG